MMRFSSEYRKCIRSRVLKPQKLAVQKGENSGVLLKSDAAVSESLRQRKPKPKNRMQETQGYPCFRLALVLAQPLCPL